MADSDRYYEEAENERRAEADAEETADAAENATAKAASGNEAGAAAEVAKHRKAIRNTAKSRDGRKKLKKKIIKKVIKLAIPILLPVIGVLTIIFLIYGGIMQAMSMVEWPWALSEEWWETCTDEQLYRELVGKSNSLGMSRITEDDLNNMMISRNAWAKILEEVIDYNRGSYFGDYAKINLEVEGDDQYVYFDYDERREDKVVTCDADDPDAYATVFTHYGWLNVSTGTTYTEVPGQGWKEDPNGGYYQLWDGTYVSTSSVKWCKVEEVLIKTNKRVFVDGQKKKMDFDISNKWMYIEFPMDWEYVYLFAVYHFIDKNNMTYLTLEDSYEGETIVTSIDYDELFKLIQAFIPKFTFATLPSAKNPLEGNQSNVFEALIKYNGKWKDFQKWRDTWKEGKKFKYNGQDYYTNEEIKSLYKNTNPYGEQLMAGKPQKVIWYWTDYKIRQYDENGEPVKDPVIHRTTLFYPISILEEVKTVIARYDYSGSYEHIDMYEDATEIDVKKYPITWAGISSDADFSTPKTEKTTTAALKEKLANMITGRDIVPSSSVFDTERMDQNIFDYGDERDWEMISWALSEMPQGKDIGAAVEAAYLWPGEDIETVRSKYNSSHGEPKEGNIEYGVGGLRTRGIVYESETGMRELYGVSGDTRLKNTSQGRFLD